MSPPLRFSAALTFTALLTTSHAIVDLDTDSLDDVWEEFFGAQSLVADLDEDGDGGTNLEESAAGTDPFDPLSRHQATDVTHTPGADEASVTFPTEAGKVYCIAAGPSLDDGAMTELPTTYHGTGEVLTVTLISDAPPVATGSVLHDVWNVAPGDSADEEPVVFTEDPDATESLPDLRARTNTADNYSGRMRGWLVPNKSGTHKFYLTARGSAQFYIGTTSNPSSATIPVASVDTELIGPEEWNHPLTATYSRNLTAGNRYYIEVRHQHGVGGDHCAVGWAEPKTVIDIGDVHLDNALQVPLSASTSGPTVIPGKNLQPYTRGEPATTLLDGAQRMFFKVIAKELDQDGDAITDWAEKQMGGDGNFFFARSKSTSSGSDDITTLTNALTGGGQTVGIARANTTAYEDNRLGPDIVAGKTSAEVEPDVAFFHLSRTGSLQPVAVQYTIGSTGSQSSTPSQGADFNETDLDGNPISGMLVIPFGHVSARVVIDPIDDGVHEYPEALRFNLVDVGGPGAGDYDLGALHQLDATIYDARDIPEQEILFVGRSSEDPNHTTTTKGTAVVSGFLNGQKNYMRLNSLIMAPFSSPQNDSHLHKANPGPLNGPIIYEITETPGDPASDPKIGELLDYPWSIHDIQGASTGTQVVDGLFAQNGETPIYLNWHTNDNQGGELWAIFGEESGSIEEPDPPADPPAISALAGADLERDVRRFLNQASFGATDAEVAYLLNEIATTHASEPIPRIAAYEAWIDEQVAMPQTHMVDYILAADNQEWKLRGFFDPSRWFTHQFDDPANPLVDVPDLPTAWPAIDRSRPDPLEWFPTANYPLTQTQINWGRKRGSLHPLRLGRSQWQPPAAHPLAAHGERRRPAPPEDGLLPPADPSCLRVAQPDLPRPHRRGELPRHVEPPCLRPLPRSVQLYQPQPDHGQMVVQPEEPEGLRHQRRHHPGRVPRREPRSRGHATLLHRPLQPLDRRHAEALRGHRPTRADLHQRRHHRVRPRADRPELRPLREQLGRVGHRRER